MQFKLLSHDRMLSILDLFDASHSEWTVDALHERLGYSRSTLYRYLKTLSDAGLLSSFSGKGYTLGPRIIELDYQIVQSDPLIHNARPIMKELVSQHSGISLLCRRYKHRVLCVHQESSTEKFRSTFERGKVRSIVYGAASQIILAHISTYQLGKVYEEFADDFPSANLGSSLGDVKENLKKIRNQGWLVTKGQVSAGVVGIAAPVFEGSSEIIASLSLTLPGQEVSDERIAAIGEQLVFCANVLTNALR